MSDMNQTNTSKEKTFKPAKRRKARQLVLQALYQWQVSKTDYEDIVRQFHENNNFEKVDSDYFYHLLQGIIRNRSDLDMRIEPLIDRSLEQLDFVEHALLWIGCFELLHLIEIPYRVIINEAIELTKSFGAQDSYRYINGILDKIALQVRADEFNHYRNS